MVRYILHRLRKNDRGVALLELAIIAPVLMILLLGIIEFGWIFNGYITIYGAAREGARVYVTGGEYENAINNHISSLPALSISSIDVKEGEFRDDDMKVVVEGSLSLLVGDSFPLRAKATMRSE